MSRTTQRARAFSLVEVMMGATVLVVGFVGLIQAITTCSELLDTAHKQQIAAQIIDGEIDNLRSSNWNAITSFADGTTYTMTVNSAGTGASGSYTQFELYSNTPLMAQARNFTCALTCSYLRPSSPTVSTVTFVKVTVAVTWTGNTGRIHTRSTDTYLGRYGLQLSYQKS